MKNIAIILAGGVGSRLDAGIPKQFLKVAGMSIIEHTITIFQNHTKIDEIAIVASAPYMKKMEGIVSRNLFSKVKKVLVGGKERHDSTLSAIKAYEDLKECNLIFHDAVRPLVTPLIIGEVVDALMHHKAVDVAIETADTIISIDDKNFIKSIPQRKYLRRGQTPQAFKLSVIKEAYTKALNDKNFQTTDDCGVVLKYLPEVPIYVVNGNVSNMKLTYKEDLYLLEKLFQLKTIDLQIEDISQKEQQKLKEKVFVIFGGSYGIGRDIVDIIENNGGKVYPFSRSLNNIDVSSVEAVRTALENVYIKEKRIDCIIDTAAILNKEPLANMSYDDIHNSIDVNYTGMVIVAKEAFNYLRSSHGHLLFYTSSSYTRGRMNYSIYSSTKCATVNFVQALSEEWASFGIKVNCINPERTKTPMRIKNFGEEPEGTLLESTDVAKVSIKVLLSDISGQIIDVKLRTNGFS